MVQKDRLRPRVDDERARSHMSWNEMIAGKTVITSLEKLLQSLDALRFAIVHRIMCDELRDERSTARRCHVESLPKPADERIPDVTYRQLGSS